MKINLINKKSMILIISIISILAVLISSIYTHTIRVSAELRENQPSFDIEINATPNPVAVNEETTINGNIIPNEFTINIPEKDIVLVLDVSNSMTDKINGTNITKLENMNEAVVKFLDVIKNTPNMKVSIIAYSSDAYINPIDINGTTSIWKKSSEKYKTILDYKCSTVNFFDANSENDQLRRIVKTIVNNVGEIYYDSEYKYKDDSIEGGTSTGEALRQANRILNTKEKVEPKNKSIVLMTDGVPSYYSSNSNAKNDKNIESSFYMNINEKILRGNKKDDSPYLGGSGSITTSGVIENATKYAEKIGGNIEKNNKNINMYTIGYGVGNNTAYIQRIHESIAKNTKNLYFSSEDEGVEKAFTDIAYKISTKQESSNLVINLKLPENIQCKDGNTAINLGNDNTIKYTGEYINNNSQIKYTAEKVPFSFIIKVSESGTYDLFGEENNSSIDFSVIGQDMSIKLPKVNLIVGIPNIKAELKDKQENYTNKYYDDNSNIPVTYTIKSEPFELNTQGSDNGIYDENLAKDVVFLIDETIPKDSDFYNSIVNKILSYNDLKLNDTRYALITYGVSNFKYYKLDDYRDSDSEIKNAYTNIQNSSSKDDYNSQYLSAVKSLVNKLEIGKQYESVSIKSALDKAENLLENRIHESITENFDTNRVKTNKNIVIIGKSEINDIDSIKKVNGDYKVITFNYGEISSSTKRPGNNLEELHYKLIGKEQKQELKDKKSDYYYINMDYSKYLNANYNSNNDSNFFSDINNINKNYFINNCIMGYIAEDLKNVNNNVSTDEMQEYIFNVKLEFNIGSNFIFQGLNPISNSDHDAETNIIPIKYKLDENDGIYKAQNEEITFFIKPNITEINKMKTSIGFSSPNYIVYSGLGGQQYRTVIETPIINRNVQSIDVKHGIYMGIANGDNMIDTTKRTFSKGAAITFGAYFNGVSNGQTITLKLGEGLNDTPNLNSNPKIYAINSNNELIDLETGLSKINNKEYSGSISGLQDGCKKLLVIYTQVISEEYDDYINTIGINNKYIPAEVKISSELPDLF